MTLLQRIRADLEQGLRGRDKVRYSVLRLILASIKNAEIEQQADLDDAGVLDVIEKEAKKRRESIEAFQKGERDDLVAQEKAELAILLEYLPEQMSREEIVTVARRVIQEVGASSPREKGKVMSQLMPQVKGKAEGQVVSAVVSELLGDG